MQLLVTNASAYITRAVWLLFPHHSSNNWAPFEHIQSHFSEVISHKVAVWLWMPTWVFVTLLAQSWKGGCWPDWNIYIYTHI